MLSHAMNQIGMDISGYRSKSVDEFAGQQFDYVITVCDNAREACPYFPGGGKRIHHSFEDPAAARQDHNQNFSAECATRSRRGCKSSFEVANS